MMNISVSNKRFWMSNTLIVASLIMAALFPTDGGFQSMISLITFLVVLPALFIRFFLKENLSSFGLTWGDGLRGATWTALSLALIMSGFFWIYRYTDALSQVNIPLSVRSSFLSFLIYVVIASIFLAVQEFFFRGFVLNIWKKTLGYGAILAQSALALILPLANSHGKPGAETLFIAVLSLCSGWIAFQSRSIAYSFFFFLISVILGISMVLVFAK